MKSNTVAENKERTYEGGVARTPAPAAQLLRQVSTCLLFEDTFYADGATIANQIAATCLQVTPMEIARVAVLAREELKLRHVPLFLLAQLDLRRAAAPDGLIAPTVERVIQRADELAELLSIVQKVNDGRPLKKCLSAQMKKGLARAFRKFSPYQLAKYNRDSKIKLRDVLFLCHAKPKDAEQAATWKALVDGTLEAPDTWEVALSSGADKKETWERLLVGRKLGYIALLMNLRNMDEAKVDPVQVDVAIGLCAKDSKALPFRFISAAKHAPSHAQALSDAMVSAISEGPKLAGSTALLIDVSGSMDVEVSGKSTLNRWEAGAALGILLREVCERVRVFTFSNMLVEVSNLRGLAMLSGVRDSQPHGGTALAKSLKDLPGTYDRVIVITDEQAQDGLGGKCLSAPKGYVVNVAAYAPALDVSGSWTRVNGFSERIVDYIRMEEGGTLDQ